MIDLGTTSAMETRKLAVEFSGKGAAVLFDIPVRGDKTGARDGSLYMFGDGDEATFQ